MMPMVEQLCMISDHSVRGMWQPQTCREFQDVRIIDTDAPPSWLAARLMLCYVQQSKKENESTQVGHASFKVLYMYMYSENVP